MQNLVNLCYELMCTCLSQCFEVADAGILLLWYACRWYDVGCVLLKDPRHSIELTTFSQATPVPADCVCDAQDATPADYPLRWSGLSVTVGQIIQHRIPHVDHADWHAHFTGMSRRDLLLSAAQALAGSYRSKLTEMGYVF